MKKHITYDKMTTKVKKIEYFSAFVDWLNTWNKESGAYMNDLSKLKVLKLLFLWVSANKDYLDIFDNFVAWDLWPVEKDIYDLINKDQIKGYTINNSALSKKCEDINIDKDALEFSKKTIDFLRNKNSGLIKLSAGALVDITHKWQCWILARNLGFEKIPTRLILSEDWVYF